MQFVQFRKSNRISKIHVFDLSEGFQKCPYTMMENKHFFMAQGFQCTAALTSQGFQPFCGFFDSIVGICIQTLGFALIKSRFNR